MSLKLGIGVCVALLPLAFLAGKGTAPLPPAPVPSPELSALKAEVVALREQGASKEEARSKEVENLRAELAQVRSERARPPALPKPVEPAAAPSAADAFEALAAKLTAPGATREERVEAWRKLVEAGFLDRSVALFEKKARENPSSAEAQMDFARACVQRIFATPEGPAKGLWASKADQAFDAALKIDPRHWEARFSKAIGLSFWPPIFGKQPEAIRQFETLIVQQEEGAPEPHFAQTYVLLGNLYQQQGKTEKAAEIWGKGAALFPMDEGLKAKLGK